MNVVNICEKIAHDMCEKCKFEADCHTNGMINHEQMLECMKSYFDRVKGVPPETHSEYDENGLATCEDIVSAAVQLGITF